MVFLGQRPSHAQVRKESIPGSLFDMTPLLTLSEIAANTGTDKGMCCHWYTLIYDQLFDHLRDGPVNFMEHGLLSGQSAEMWSGYFRHPQVRLHFVDINDYGYRPTDPRIHICFGNAGASQDMFCPNGAYTVSGPLDVIVDDAGHIATQQMDAFDIGWPMVKPGGMYIIEDCHSVHSPQLSNTHLNIIEYFGRIACAMQDEKGALGCAAPDPGNPWHSILSIEMRRGLIIVRKRP